MTDYLSPNLCKCNYCSLVPTPFTQLDCVICQRQTLHERKKQFQFIQNKRKEYCLQICTVCQKGYTKNIAFKRQVVRCDCSSCSSIVGGYTYEVCTLCKTFERQYPKTIMQIGFNNFYTECGIVCYNCDNYVKKTFEKHRISPRTRMQI